MKRILLAFALLFAITSFAEIFGQCDRLIELSKEALEARNYQLAIERLLDTRDNCPQNKDQINALIKNAFQQIEEEKKTVDRVLNQMYFYKDKFGLTLKEVELRYRYGFIDKQGNEVISFEFEEATPFSKFDGFARVKKDNQKYLLDTTGTTFLLAESLDELSRGTEALDLSKNILDSLPRNIGKYQDLKVVWANGPFNDEGRIKELPESFTQLYQLKHVNLSNNRLEYLPKEITKLDQLQWLELSENLLDELPEKIGTLSQLQKLSLSSNYLTQLPENIGNLSQLKSLFLSRNLLTKLPNEISKLKQLQELDISYNFITQLPEQINRLTQLKRLYIQGNPLTKPQIEVLRKKLPNCKIII